MFLSLNPRLTLIEEQSDGIASRSLAFTFMYSVEILYSLALFWLTVIWIMGFIPGSYLAQPQLVTEACLLYTHLDTRD